MSDLGKGRFIELRLLRNYLALANELHFGRAADRVGISQPPFSQSIAALERQLGTSLFNRSKRNVELTVVGKALLPYAEAILSQTNDLPTIAARLARGQMGHLRMSFVSSGAYEIIPTLVGNYRRLYPDVSISLFEVIGPIQFSTVLEDTSDVGLVITTPEPQINPLLSHVLIQRERLIAALPEAWLGENGVPIVDGHVDFKHLVKKPLIFFPHERAPAMHGLIWRHYEKFGAEPILGQSAAQMHTIISLVSAGLGFAVVPASVRNLARKGVRYVPFAADLPEMEFHLVWRHTDTSPLVDQLVEIARRELAT